MEETKRYIVRLKESVNAYPMYFGHSNSLDYAKRIARKAIADNFFGAQAYVYDYANDEVIYRVKKIKRDN